LDILRPYLSRWYWRHGFSISRAAATLLSAFGALWLLIEIISFFSKNSANEIKTLWWLFLLVGMFGAFWLNRPRHSVGCKLSTRDITIEICVGNVFERAGSLVVGSNTTFDTDGNIIDRRSIQGQFTSRYFTSVAHLDADITTALQGVSSQPCGYSKTGKQERYPVGTVAQIQVDAHTAYFLAIASINGNKVADATFDDLKLALPALWEHISNRGKLDDIIIPILGTGFARLPQSREEIVREIINSFVAACAMRRFTPSLTIVLFGPDFYKNEVDLQELGRYLQHICKYTQFGGSAGKGTAV
jgi:hypothetical protein